MGTQIKVSTYSNVLSVVRSVFISVGRIFMRVLAYLPPAMSKVFDDRKGISVGRNFCIHTPVCHASWVLNGIFRGTQVRFLSASSCIPRTAKFAYLRLHTPQGLASSIRSGALYISLPPIEASSASHSSYSHLISISSGARQHSSTAGFY